MIAVAVGAIIRIFQNRQVGLSESKPVQEDTTTKQKAKNRVDIGLGKKVTFAFSSVK